MFSRKKYRWYFCVVSEINRSKRKDFLSRQESPIYGLSRSIASYVSSLPNVIPQSSEGRHRNAITVVYGFVTAIHPGIAGQWVDEVGVFAASNDFSWEANLDDELNPCLPPFLPTSLSVHPPESVPPWRDHPRRPRIRIKFTTTIIAEGFRWVACRINRESKKTLPGNLALLSRSTGFTFTRVRKVLLRIYELSSSLSALFRSAINISNFLLFLSPREELSSSNQ